MRRKQVDAGPERHCVNVAEVDRRAINVTRQPR
jgi:hypothetical protein